MMIVLVGHHITHQGLTIGHRDLVIIRMDFVKGQKAVAIAAIFDKRGLKAGFYPGNLGKIDIATQLLLGTAFKIEFFNPRPIQHHHTRLFGV